MGVETAISWTEATFQPWIGCSRVSPACDHCYAESMDKARGGFGDGGQLHWGDDAPRKVMSEENWRKPARWNRNAAERGLPILVFCSSLADVFEDRGRGYREDRTDELDAPRARLFDLIEATPNLIWQLLTKRPQNVMRMVPERWTTIDPATFSANGGSYGWPSNCWIGTTAEDQPHFNVRSRHLRALTAAPVRFLSCEPLLGPIDLDLTGIDWTIIGGESGPGWRPMNPGWVRSMIAQCERAGVPVFYKQDSALRPAKNATFDRRLIHQFPKQARR